MFVCPYRTMADATAQEKLKAINKQINEEKQKPEVDWHKIMRLEEEKLLQGMFQNGIGSPYSKYRNPW